MTRIAALVVVLLTPALVAAEELEPIELGLVAGAGLSGFAYGDTTDLIDVGGTWEARLLLGSNMPVGLEVAYIGALHDIDDPDNATLLGNGIEGAYRVDLGTFDIQPFVAAGLGWMHYSVREASDLMPIAGDDDIMTVPATAGVTWQLDRVLIDVRASYRFAFDDELIQGDPDIESETALDSWAITARAGFVL